MGGGLIQIVAYGAQDLYLTGIPEITFFKFVYKRYTNFAIETIDLKFNGDINFDETISCILPKNGDLVKDLFVKITLPAVALPRSKDDYIESEMIEKRNDAETKYNNFKTYIKYIFDSIRIINNLLDKDNVTFLKIKKEVDDYFANKNNFNNDKSKVEVSIGNIFNIQNRIEKMNNLKIDDDFKKK